MYTSRSTSPSARLVAAALSATLATAGLGLTALPAFADEAGADAAPVEQTAPVEGDAPAIGEGAAPAPSTVFATSLTAEQIAADPAYATAGEGIASWSLRLELTNNTALATALYDAIDQLRADGGAGAAIRDAALEQAAYQRAAEGTLLPASIRPNGTLFSTADASGRATAEILVRAQAGGAGDAAAALAALTDEQRALLASATNVGVGTVVDAAGNICWAIELASDGAASEAPAPADGAATYRMPVASANVQLGTAGGDLALEAGKTQTVDLPASVSGDIVSGPQAASFVATSANLDGSSLTWNSADPAVATVDATGAVTGVGSGNCTLSATGDAGQFIFNATVTGGEPAASTVNLADCTVAGIAGPYEATGEAIAPAFTVIDANNSTVDASQYTYAFTDNVEAGTATLTITAVEGSTAVTGSTTKTFEIVAPTPAPVAVPGVIGGNVEDASAALAGVGLVPNAVEGEPAPDEASVGLVYATDPAAESLVDAGSTVTLSYYAPLPAAENGDEGTGDEGEQGNPEGDAPIGEGAAPGEGDTEGGEGEQAPAPVDLAQAGASAAVAPAHYDGGNPVEPAVTVTLPDGTQLVAGTDYTVAYANNAEKTVEGGAPATATVTGIGAYTGTIELTFQIVDAPAETTDLAAAGYSIAPIPAQTFTGGPVQPTVTLNGATALVAGTDYTVAYEQNVSVGTGKVTVTGQGAYSGTLTAEFAIQGDIAQATVSGLDNQVYTGGELKPTPKVTLGETVLTAGTDYDVSYANNVNAGTATLTVTGKGSYSGTLSAEFAIAPKSIKGAQISPIASVSYSGTAQTPAVTVTDGTTVLSANDYTVAYEQNTNAGTAHVVVTGTGNYRDSIDATFKIAAVDLARATIVMPNMNHTGAALTPKPVSVKVGDLALVEGTDYDIVGYGSNTNVGDAKITLQGKGNFTGTVVANWKIVQQGTADTGTTETLPQTGDSTNVVAMAIGGVVGVALIGTAAGLIIHRVRSNKRDGDQMPRR